MERKMDKQLFLASSAGRLMLSEVKWSVLASDGLPIRVGDTIHANLWKTRSRTVSGEVLGFGHYEGEIYLALDTPWEVERVEMHGRPTRTIPPGEVCAIVFPITGEIEGGIYYEEVYLSRDDPLRTRTKVLAIEVRNRLEQKLEDAPIDRPRNS